MQNYSPSGMPPSPVGGGGQPAKSKLPWIIAGGVGCLLLIVIAVAALGGLAYIASQTKPTPAAEPPPPAPAPAADTEHYVNSRAGRTGQLAANYVDFSFDYPDTWQLDPEPEPSYVRLEHSTENDLTRENFSVGWFSANVPVAGNTALLSQSVNQLGTQVSGGFPGYEKISEGPTTVGVYDGYELRFKGSSKRAGGRSGGLDFWGRIVVLVPDEDAKKGVSLILLATNQAPGVDGPEDVGVEGELPSIINSFRFGK